ncbi:universal stress protein [Salinilacihabitans rarus]|uniref:universal stress protein n=1 Tax=Salinilacihabitans rarus TaxID=2961596 RepID=UPI0020C8766B|nr:universal stress protein [Salinilacihabitans rarus]
MYNDVLVPTDGSEGTRQAIGHALVVARQFDATVHALSIVPEGPYGTLEGEEESASAEADAERAVSRVADDAARKDLDVRTEVRRGVPDEEILAYADENDVDVIVMGTHGRTGLDRVLVGSVTERVVRNAEIPVLTVRASDQPRISDPEDAGERALEALAEDGYDDASLLEEPHRASNSWIVTAETADGKTQVHVDARTGGARIAHLDG